MVGMLTIGELARLGNVSVRMLRHYDAVGLLVPARVAPVSGYRWYTVDQLTRLNRLLALKDLGFTLEQLRPVLDDEVTAEQLRGMLRLRRAELTERITADTERLARVERRLRTIESEGTMSTHDVELTAAGGHHLAALSTRVDGTEAIGGVVGPLFGRLAQALGPAGGPAPGPAVAWYDFGEDGAVDVHVGAPVAEGHAAGDAGYRIVDLPALPEVAATVHHGSMETIADAWQALVRWVADHGYTGSATGCREVYLATPEDDPSAWVTRLEQPLVPARGPGRESA